MNRGPNFTLADFAEILSMYREDIGEYPIAYRATFAVACAAIMAAAAVLSKGLISYESRHPHRTLVNQMSAVLAAFSFAYTLAGCSLLVSMVTVGMDSPGFCWFYSAASNVIAMPFILTVNEIMALR